MLIFFIFASSLIYFIFFIMDLFSFRFVYDFNGKKVRKNGKALDKFSLCQEIHYLSMSIYHDYYRDLTYSLYPELYKYSDCVERLKSIVAYEQN